MKKQKSAVDTLWSVILAVASVLYMYPIVMILFNSLKFERAISTNTAFILRRNEPLMCWSSWEARYK